MSLTIQSLATANPVETLPQAEAYETAQHICCQTAEQAAILKVLYRRAGVKMRYAKLNSAKLLAWYRAAQEHLGGEGVATKVTTLGGTTAERMKIYRDEAGPLALRAAGDAMVAAGVTPPEITHIVTVSCTGFSAPGIDIELINGLELPRTVERTHVGFMSCHGSLNGLRVARLIATADPGACVLLCAVELCSLHYRTQWDPIKFIGNAIFADGAAAMIARPSREGDAWRCVASGSCVLSDSLDGIRWNVGDHGFEIDLSPRVPDLIKQQLGPWLQTWLASQGLTVDQVASWAIHPGGPRVLGAVEESLGITSDATTVSREVLSEYGNMSSPTVMFILDRLRQRSAPLPCVALAFGPGLTAEAALFR